MRILRAAAIVASATLLVKLGGMAKELMVAGYFGLSDELEAYLMALVLPSFILSIVAGGSSSAIVPAVIHVRAKHGRSGAQRLLSSAACLHAGLLLAAMALLALAAPLILPALCSGFSTEKLMMTERFFYWLLPALFIRGFSIQWADILNAGHKFAVASLAPAATSLSTIAALLVLGRSCGAYALVGAFLAGSMIEATLLSFALQREGWRLVPRWRGMDEQLRAAINQYLPGVGSAIVMGSSDIIDSSMAATLPAGGVAALGYGNKLTSFVLSVGATSLTTAALPHLSTMAAERRFAEMRSLLWRFVRLLFLISVPLTGLLIVASREIVALVFQRGAFSAGDTVLVAHVQSALLLQVPFYLTSCFAVYFVMALRANRTMFWGTVISATVNVIGNYVFMIWFGVVGIALSTALVHAVAAAFLLFAAKRLIDAREADGLPNDRGIPVAGLAE